MSQGDKMKIIPRAFILFLLASPAAASTLVATYTGMVTSGSDRRGPLAGNPESIVGMPITISFRFDPANVVFDQVYESERLAHYNGLGIITVNGKSSYISAPISQGYVNFLPGRVSDFDQARYFNSTIAFYGNIYSNKSNFLASIGRDQLVNYTLDPTKDNGVIYVRTGGPHGGIVADGSVSRFSVSNIGVPEPSSWTLMIAGFGVVGCMVRRQRVVGSA
jgi:hypothetical protein